MHVGEVILGQGGSGPPGAGAEVHGADGDLHRVAQELCADTRAGTKVREAEASLETSQLRPKRRRGGKGNESNKLARWQDGKNKILATWLQPEAIFSTIGGHVALNMTVCMGGRGRRGGGRGINIL